MWRIVKQSDRETMIDELQRLKPLAESVDQEQRARAVAFTIGELQASNLPVDTSINLSGSRVGDSNYLSLIIGAQPQPDAIEWQLNKTNLPKGLTREQLVAYLSGLGSDGQQARAVNFALGELNSSDEQFGSINMSGSANFLSLSVSAAD